MDRDVGQSNEHVSSQQRAGEIAYLLQQAQAECSADIEKVEDGPAKELFGRIAGYLDVAIQALYSYQGGQPVAGENSALMPSQGKMRQAACAPPLCGPTPSRVRLVQLLHTRP